MKDQSFMRRLGDFVLGKGFYIVLFLCVATIGISGYYLIRTMTGAGGEAEPTAGNASVVLPDDPAGSASGGGVTLPKTPDPKPSQTTPPTQTVKPSPEPAKTQPDSSSQPDDPQPVKRTDEEQAKPPVAVVYTWPVKGSVLRDFSIETLALDPTLGDWRTHGGLDISAEMGTQVLAMGAGTVTQVYEDGLMGTTVAIDHGNGLETVYCGLAGQPTVNTGDTVETGSVIGSVGGSALAESGMDSHLHLEAVFQGDRVNPLDYLPER